MGLEKQSLGPGCEGEGKEEQKAGSEQAELKADWPQEEAAGAETLRQEELWGISWSGLGDMKSHGWGHYQDHISDIQPVFCRTAALS